ncbi:MAG: putative MFS-type transporter YhjX [Gammaproteobacteria bacterium]|nr:putative MFS-type transporter YhjX [Gammaproteobacteria bacterium]
MKAPFYGWIVAGCAFLVLFLTYGMQYSFGVFVPAMLDDLGWRRAIVGGAFSLYTVVYTSLSLLSGRLTDSLGPRRVIALGGVLLGIGIVATSQMSSQWQLYFWYGIVAALGMSTAYIPCNMTVVRWFHNRRGLALGLATCGASCGILAVPLLASFIIARSDWRVGFAVLGAGVFVLINIAARFMVHDPEQMGLLPDGAEATALQRVDPDPLLNPHESVDWTLREARTTLSFWLLLAAFAVAFLTITVPFVHLPAFARDIGLAGTRGAMSVSIIGLFALIGSVSLGTLSDRIGRRGALAAALLAQLAAYLLFITARDAGTLYVGAAAFGFFYGGIASLFPALVGDLFGRTHAGAIGGFIFGGAGFLGGWGPAIAGYLRDVDGDYRLAFSLSAAAAAVSLTLFVLLPRPRRR